MKKTLNMNKGNLKKGDLKKNDLKTMIKIEDTKLRQYQN